MAINAESLYLKIKQQKKRERKKEKFETEEDRLEYIEYVKRSIVEADEDIKNGRYMTLEEARRTTKEELREEYASYNNSKSKR